MKLKIAFTEKVHQSLFSHLYPGDGLEAVAICLCGRRGTGSSQKLLPFKIVPVPYSDCIRNDGYVKWSTKVMEGLLIEAAQKNLGILKIHSHPGGYSQFSEIDDHSDRELFQSIYGWMDDTMLHASAVMLPDGEVFARVIDVDQKFTNVDCVTVVGDTIKIWPSHKQFSFQSHDIRNIQAFGEGTIGLLKTLTIGVVGCSGTGSPVIEQLARLGVNELILIDPDKIEEKNLNRIINSTSQQAKDGVLKVDSLKNAIESFGLGTVVRAISKNVYDHNTVRELSACDIIFGCVDSIDGRHLLNQLSTFYSMPYFDLGVKLIADGLGGVQQICGTVNYIKPGGSSLLSRGVYTYEDLRAAGLFRRSPIEYENLKKSGYIANVNVDRPAVISVNMLTASLAVNELLARIHNYRTEANAHHAISRFSLTDGYFQFEAEGEIDAYLEKFVGRGDMKPYLNMPELGDTKFDEIKEAIS